MSVLDIWIDRFAWLWDNRPENAMALAMQMLEVGSPLATPIFRDVVFDTDGNGTKIFVAGPQSAGSPLRVLDPVGDDVMLFREFSLLVTATDGTDLAINDVRLVNPRVSFVFGKTERSSIDLPAFAPIEKLCASFGAVKPSMILPRGQDLRCYYTEDAGAGASRVKFSIVCRSEPRRLMAAARLVEPDTVGTEGKV